jgi:hypothetical protein
MAKTTTKSRKKATKSRKKASVGSTSTCKAVGSRRKVGQKNYKISAYRSSKRDAQKIADSHRSKGKGKLARVMEATCGGKKTYQVLTFG